MKKFIVALAASAAFATPAFAQDAEGNVSGFRVEARASYDRANGDDGFALHGGIGYDFAISEKSSLGIDAEIGDSSINGATRDLYAGARYTTAVGPETNVYVKAGYTNQGVSTWYAWGSLDGVRAGLGIQHHLSENFYIGTEATYSNYDYGVDRFQGGAVIGARF